MWCVLATDLEPRRARRAGWVGSAQHSKSKEALNERVDHAFDTQERAAATIKMLLPIADRLIPGHFMEMYRDAGTFTWDDTMEFPLVIR